MDIGHGPLKIDNVYQKSFFISKWCYGWIISIFIEIYKGIYDVKKLPKIFHHECSSVLAKKMQHLWDAEIPMCKTQSKNPNLWKIYFKMFRRQFCYSFFMGFILWIPVRALQILFLAKFLNLLTQQKYDLTEIYTIALSLSFITALFIICQRHLARYLVNIGTQMRVAAGALIYRKLFTLSLNTFTDVPIGKIINLMGNDLNRFENALMFIHYIWVCPAVVVYTTAIMWYELEYSCLSGIVFGLLGTVLLQGVTANLYSNFRKQLAYHSDLRIQSMDELVSGIKVIKMYAWEKSFSKLVNLFRFQEIQIIKKILYLASANSAVLLPLAKLSLYFSILTHVLLGNTLTPQNVYVVAQCFSVFRTFVVIAFPPSLKCILEMNVIFKRIEEFLMLENKQDLTILTRNPDLISIEKVYAGPDSKTEILKNISLTLPAGKLYAVIGTVGSGKTSLLHLLLGELRNNSGDIFQPFSVSFASQEPWLFSSSIKSNILFGREFNKELYSTVISCCSLQEDFLQLSEGDLSLVGERGVVLSGGQKARIGLARSVYQKADLYLLDDPLSAVDASVGKHIFDKCIVKYLEGKTRLLVTHQLQYLKKSDAVIVMKNGTIEAMDTFDNLFNDGSSVLQTFQENTEENDADTQNSLTNTDEMLKSSATLLNKMVVDLPKIKQPLGIYLKAGSKTPFLIFVIILYVVSQVFYAASDYWLAIWIEKSQKWEIDKLFRRKQNASFYDPLYVYTGLICAALVLAILGIFFYLNIVTKSSQVLHNKMFTSLIKTSINFVEYHSSGRILNRFSKDMGEIDETLPVSLLDSVQLFLIIIGSVAVIGVTNIGAAIPSVIFVVVTGILFIYISKISKEIKHLENFAKSPVLSYINTTINGLCTIRSASTKENLIKEFDSCQDVHTSAINLVQHTQTAFFIWLNLLAALYQTILYVLIIELNRRNLMEARFGGLIITMLFAFNGLYESAMRSAFKVIDSLASIERVAQYTLLPEEKSSKEYKSAVDDKWPENGRIQFVEVNLKYSANDIYALKDINISIGSKDKIGIIGRTGSGKSSLISVLFRLIEYEGIIFIDGIDTKTIELATLRKKLSIIPQDPVLFSNTLRCNLDPFNEYTDSEIWEALEQVELKKSISSLDFYVSEKGSNFSVGQKQLICLARALLRKRSILVLDEATANIDLQTDKLIQCTVKEKFKNCTVITVAHRLNTIIQSDKVLVMNSGNAVEFDHPYILLQNKDSYFVQLLAQINPTTREELYQDAEKHFQKHSNKFG